MEEGEEEGKGTMYRASGTSLLVKVEEKGPTSSPGIVAKKVGDLGIQINAISTWLQRVSAVVVFVDLIVLVGGV